MDRLFIIVRHGDYGNGQGDEPLSKVGLEQMHKLREVINTFVIEKAHVAGEENVIPAFFSFSSLKRAFESIQALHWASRDIVITSEGNVNRRDIREPKKILDKVLGLANYYGASVIIIVAHGEMPAVVAETAHEFATGKKLSENLPYVGKGRGFIVNMVTGEVISIGYDSLDEKKPPESVTRFIPEFVPPKVRPAGGPHPRDAGPYPPDGDDDIPF